VDHLETLEQILRERLPGEDGLQIVRHVLGNPCQVEYVTELRRHLEGRVVGVRVRPAGGSSPTTIQIGAEDGEVRFERDGRPIHFFNLEARDRISLLVATEGYGRYLPDVYTRGVQRAHGGSPRAEVDFLRRFLLVFQTLNHETVSRVAGRHRIVDPVQSDPKFLPWLASWLGFTLDERIPVTRRRIFLRRAVELFRWRGTVRGITEMVKTLTGLDIAVQQRRGPQPMELGNCALSRPPANIDEDDHSAAASESAAMMLPYVTHAGEHLLVSPRFSREEYFTIELEERDTLVSRYRDRLPELLEQIVRVARHERPAHLNFVICFRDEATAHNELVLAGDGATTPNSVLGRACLAYSTSNHTGRDSG